MLNNDIKTILWEGPNIPCINICKGDMLSDVVFKIATEICDLIKDLDSNTISLNCIIDRSKIYGKIDLYLLMSLLLTNDCDIKTLIDAKLDELDTTELLVNNLDLKCYLQQYLDEYCTIIRFYNQPGLEVNPNHPNTIFQKAEVALSNIYYVSDVDQSVWEWNGIQYIKNNIIDLNTICICELNQLDLDVKKVYQVIIDNICKTKTNGIIKACDNSFKTIPFDTIDPNTITTIFLGENKNQNFYYISNITHKIWRWVSTENVYLPSLLTSSNIDLSSIDNCLFNAELELQNWLDQYKVYQEPLITSCLSTTPTIFSSHLTNITDTNICSIQNSVGSAKDVFYTILNGCAKIVNFTGEPNGINMVLDQPIPNNIEYYYVNKDYDYPFIWNGFQYAPIKEKLVNQENAQWVKICSLLSRVKNIENTCCTPTCDLTTIGFTATYNEEDGLFTLVFDQASGTNISDDFTDCGSILTATDSKGNKVKLNIELSQDAIIELDLNGLKLSDTVLVNIKSCLSNGTLTCKSCNTFTLPKVNACGICKICAVDSSDTGSESVIVYYTLDSNPSTVQNTKLFGGQCLTFKLPEDKPTIKSIITSSSSISLESDPTYPCNDVAIPAPVADTCWFFEVPVTDTYTQIALKSTDSILANQTRLDFDFVESTIFRETYNTYIDYTNTNGSSISGEIITAATFNNDNAYAGIGLPQNLPQNVTLMTPSCNSAFHKTWDIEGQGGDYIVTFQSSNNGGTVVVSQFSAGTFKLKYNITQDQNNPDRWGFILKVQGQPTNINGIQKPEIAIKHPINGALTWIKGELLADDCQCPS